MLTTVRSEIEEGDKASNGILDSDRLEGIESVVVVCLGAFQTLRSVGDLRIQSLHAALNGTQKDAQRYSVSLRNTYGCDLSTTSGQKVSM